MQIITTYCSFKVSCKSSLIAVYSKIPFVRVIFSASFSTVYYLIHVKRIGGTMVCVFATSVIEHEFETHRVKPKTLKLVNSYRCIREINIIELHVHALNGSLIVDSVFFFA